MFFNFRLVGYSFVAGAFLEAIENLGFDYIASGHYAHVVHPSPDDVEGPSVLQLSKDKVFVLHTK
jgi:tRNA U34 2-thiouridine synthase MnmA/TrmU